MNMIRKQDGMAPVAIMIVVLGLVLVGGGVVYFLDKDKAETMTQSPSPSAEALVSPEATSDSMMSGDKPAGTPQVKEFSMTSYYEMTNSKASTHFSLNEINVKKGDLVRIKVTNTKGNHDFNIDEFGIKKPTPLNEEVVIEFTADKAGSFKYYCAFPNHRQMGQEGTLIVSE